MRNNRMFQSLGIGAIASMVRKTNGVQEGRSDEVQEGSGVINDDPEYSPNDGEEVDDVVVNKTVKVQTLSCLEEEEELKNICCNASRKGDGPSSRTKKRILEPDEPALDRVRRQKAKMATATGHQESLLRMDSETSVQMGDELPQMDEEAMTTKTRLRKGKGLERITKSLGSKVPIQIAEGMKRPEKPASECGLIARSHLPVLPHFKLYKKC
ncbi:unnamed protein product [Triticum turgidum subsp. durum]|uniref:Uncharacterized protein n=1 Tax=Triticum turgidum subsp. durum TaxID=4567 RepID=A0A9R0WTE3_TRITD|nr:unnamed protein product [Triticum turgidum subsp. durum]